ncbi:unnamed protein product [Alopecurus aequalis]
MATNAAAPAPAPLSLKLLVDTKAQRVLFAEAGKDAVDFLFSLLALPVGTTTKLLGADSMVGSVGDLYASFAKLDATYVLPGAKLDDALLHPAVTTPAAAALLRLPATVPVQAILRLQPEARQHGVAILKASLQSKTVLTDVYLAKKATGCKTENLNS